ncbi:hypothetical protein LTR24_006754 [Lithohypha guttulata]|uniref:Uncharacterized protein n=1 Tax=Lithohypha guttulata TaxID=1690604 RepID=A0ABR0K565_9EURO|nr:hypothetical protein LTR24_006754 [Lithohypha guttulata]
MFVKSFNALALASVIAFGMSASTAQSARHGTTPTETTPLSQNCILGLKSTTVYCPRDIKDLDPSIDLTALPLLEDIHEEWRDLNAVDLAHLPTRSEPAAESALPALLDRDSQIGGTNNFALVCLYDQGLTNDCQKNWGYYCGTNGALHTTKEETEEGCDLCECIDLNPKPACVLGMTGALYCQRDIHDEELWSEFQPHLPSTTTSGTLLDDHVTKSELHAGDGTEPSGTTRST